MTLMTRLDRDSACRLTGTAEMCSRHPYGSKHRDQRRVDMSAVYSRSSSLTEPEQDMLAWYRLGPDPDPYCVRPLASMPDFELPDSTTGEPIQMQEAA
jgi:hypothetical protein